MASPHDAVDVLLHEVDVDEGEVCMTMALMESLYKPIVDQIVGLVTTMLDRLKAKGLRSRMCSKIVASVHGPAAICSARQFLGDALLAGHVITKSHLPSDCTQIRALFKVVVSHLEDPVYTDTVGCNEVGKVTIRVTPVTHFLAKDSQRTTVRVLHTGLVLEVRMSARARWSI
ncbi:hypothetical protein AMAG_20003 [Allomyces macrogynus ATCC 38327]|uniref:Uncharacterized protein n=1 Tax=Allomyces macrogynus (strain ATCC 38327) TaxID=578462 RepID=A0A0L0T4F4_ALLM3|nr:hypothetical protein AMAG_20003 [Allomyces macrogynus ATCC 38327]|eukprot:KNE69600.1 hypothetical protein AMAG_20003 [Allomyces macrogynus ATCC 38327]